MVTPEASQLSSYASHITRHASHLLPLAFSCIALALVFWGLLQLDLPIARYMRSVTVDYVWARDQILIPWMAFTSWAGDIIGEGKNLVVLSVILLVIGRVKSWPNLLAAGWQSLLAHGVAALLANGLKHVIGRPRPRLVHSGGWVWMPSMQTGLDSFPSGHATAAFAVATVLAKRFPSYAVVFFGVAGFVGLSRVLRGAHFLTDIAGGMLFGILAGSLLARPIRQWRSALIEGFLISATGMVYVFAVFWVVSQPPDEHWGGRILAGVGWLLILFGGWHRIMWWKSRTTTSAMPQKVTLSSIALGFAVLSQSWIVMAAAACVSGAYWFKDQDDPSILPPASRLQRMIQESVIVVGILLTLFIVWQEAGILAVQ
ncbi:MAG TPA: phosphatase PAP2 family protein [Nitrospiraceae bacterium]